MYKPYRVCAVLKGRVTALFWSEMGRDFAYFGRESGMIFKARECMNVFTLFPFQMGKKEREMCELINRFRWCSNLSNDDIIS